MSDEPMDGADEMAVDILSALHQRLANALDSDKAREDLNEWIDIFRSDLDATPDPTVELDTDGKALRAFLDYAKFMVNLMAEIKGDEAREHAIELALLFGVMVGHRRAIRHA